MGVALVAVEKGGERLEVHPACLAEHLRLGWREAPPAEAVDAQADAPRTVRAKRQAPTPAQEP